MQSLTKLLCVVLLMHGFATGCENPKDDRQLPSSDDAGEEQLASSPVPVTGSYLRCAYIEDPTATATTPVGCNPYDANDQLIDLDISGTDPRWTYDSRLVVTFSKNYVDPQGVRWQGRFDFAGAEVIDRATQILETRVTLTFNKDGQGETITLQDKLRNILMELAEHRYIKIAYQSIHMNAPVMTGMPDVATFEFKVNGVWEPLTINLETLDMTARTMQSNRMDLRFSGSEADWKMYLSTGLVQDLLDVLSNQPDALAWSTAVGGIWTFDPDSSFQNQAPYDLKDPGRPIELMIDMGIRKRFHGFRIDGGRDNPGRTFPNGFPDRFYFLYSDDGLNWTKFDDSEVVLADRSNLEWSWNR
ncbi:discoidin domain-containing protein [Oligoflexus tunisiensis]|uniref:discoidin domain-containing protein n=1 Tax=Oligoflexus tunisiensis TaxID=708132 RepID=UPI00114CA542|nr:discoidin domain-containing protein [Oligoflexus tunisiensis]